MRDRRRVNNNKPNTRVKISNHTTKSGLCTLVHTVVARTGMDAGRCASVRDPGERLTASAPTRSVIAGPPQARPHTGCGLAPPPHALRSLSCARCASPLSWRIVSPEKDC
jgi:hypothetical protein